MLGQLLRVIVALLTLGSATSVRTEAETTPVFADCVMRTLVLSAYPAEADSVLAHTKLDAAPVVKGKSHTFYAGTISGKPVLVGMTGIGLVNAGNATEDALTNLTCASTHTFVGAVLFSGVAGGAGRTSIGDVAAPKRWTLDDGKTWHEVDPVMLAAAAPLAGPSAPVLASQNTAGDPGCISLDPKFVPIVDLGRVPKVYLGGDGASADTLSGQASECIPDGGDTFGCQPCDAPDREPTAPAATLTQGLAWFTQNFGGLTGTTAASDKVYDALDEETAAVQTVADKHRIPFLGFRGLSAGPGDPLPLSAVPFESFVYRQIASDNAATTVAAYLKIWSGPIAALAPPAATGLQPVIEQIPGVFNRLAMRPSVPTVAPTINAPAGTTPTAPPVDFAISPKAKNTSSSERSPLDWILVAAAVALVANALNTQRRRARI